MFAVSAALAVVVSLQNPPAARMGSITGNVKFHDEFASKILGNKRKLGVYLPPNYAANPNRKYPVLYLLDGQNVFDGARSFIPNLEWRADEAAQRLIGAGLIDPIIIVAVDNGNTKRIDEYTPTRTERGGGEGDKFGQFLTTEVMPFINKTYRTDPLGPKTGLAGSSLGGLITAHLGLKYPTRFGRLGVMSPSVWWDNRVILRTVRGYSGTQRARVWIDMGTRESQEGTRDAQALRDAFLAKGWVSGRNLAYVEDGFAQHNEGAWANRFGEMLMFFYGTSR